MTDRERLIEAGWIQGKLLSPNDERLKENAHYHVPDDALLLVISQTCDLVQGSFQNEPYFEVLCIQPLDRPPKGDYLGGKNSRRIEFTLDEEGINNSHWYAVPYEKHLIDRTLLLEGSIGADKGVDDGPTLTMILRWLSRRYTRTAFPEAFVSRLAKRRNEISKKFARLNPLVSNVFVRLDPFGELDESREYSLDVMLVMESATFDDPEAYKQCEEIRKQLERQLNNCDGIAVDDISIESTGNVTIEELNGYREWDYGYLSFRNAEEAAMPIDI